MRKRINNSRDSNASRPTGEGQKSFRRTAKARPEAESRFSKPSIKRSSLRAASASDKPADKPRSFRPRAFEKDNGPREFNAGDRKEGFEKPRFDRPRFDKPGIGKPRPSGGREFKQGGFDKPAFDKPAYDRPRSSDRDREPREFKPRSSDRDREPREFKPRGEFTPGERSNREGSDRPRFDKPAGERREFSRPGSDKPRTYGKEADPRDFKPRTAGAFGDRSRSEKPAFKKKDNTEELEGRASREQSSDEGANRRVGKFETAPRYNMGSYEKKMSAKRKEESPEMRLNRYIANAGICSRREADELISSGQISVNGKIVTEMGHKVLRTDLVKFGKKALNPEKLVYVLINKPKDYITTTDDPEERKTVLDLIKGACNERIYPVGRLDRNTTGLLLMTNDGELAEKLTHPSGGIKKIYQAELDKPITTEDFEKLQHGLELEDGFIRPDEVGIVTPDAMVVGLEIHSGRNRIVRRMFEHLGYEVQKLDRTVFAGLNKKDLPRGKWRFLSEKEVVKLKFMM
jgi:23S rRNA pseudouridine2605 synthase